MITLSVKQLLELIEATRNDAIIKDALAKHTLPPVAFDDVGVVIAVDGTFNGITSIEFGWQRDRPILVISDNSAEEAELDA